MPASGVCDAYSGAALTVFPIASVFPDELTALRAGGLVLAVLLFAFAIWRRRSLSNGAVLFAIFGAIALAIVSGTELLNGLLSAFAFKQGNGGRILGLAVFAIIVLFASELRRALAAFGRTPFFALFSGYRAEETVSDLVLAATSLSTRRIVARVLASAAWGAAWPR